MKLIIQIPCFNEAKTLPETVAALPRKLEGVDEIKLLVIDDGSSDNTVSVAEELNIDKIIRLKKHTGLATVFITGIEQSLRLGADIIVNTDADNQYNAEDIKELIAPILDNKADIVIGDRGVASLDSFSFLKRKLQVFGSWIIGKASGMDIPDATSGFRAFNREAALRMIVQSHYSYTLETLIQAGARNLVVKSVKVRTNPQTRPSRLMRSIPQYLAMSGITIMRSYTMYRPLRVFSILSFALIFGGIALGIRYLYFVLSNQGSGNIQSLILAAILSIVGFQILLIGLLADLVGFNRAILEDILYRLRSIESNSNTSTGIDDHPPDDNNSS